MKRFVLVIAIAVIGNYLAAAGSGNAPLELKQTIALRAVEGRIDHLTYDPAGERLFVLIREIGRASCRERVLLGV